MDQRIQGLTFVFSLVFRIFKQALCFHFTSLLSILWMGRIPLNMQKKETQHVWINFYKLEGKSKHLEKFPTFTSSGKSPLVTTRKQTNGERSGAALRATSNYKIKKRNSSLNHTTKLLFENLGEEKLNTSFYIVSRDTKILFYWKVMIW